MATTLGAADVTTAARTGARAPACLALRPLAGTSSTLLSRQGTDRLPTSLNILEKQTPGFGSKTIGVNDDDFIIRNLPLFLADSA